MTKVFEVEQCHGVLDMFLRAVCSHTQLASPFKDNSTARVGPANLPEGRPATRLGAIDPPDRAQRKGSKVDLGRIARLGGARIATREILEEVGVAFTEGIILPFVFMVQNIGVFDTQMGDPFE